ncbi:hypothetical protein [Saccharopolyspora spinosa]|uniref:hypothetical protein n=1 Tax=Saccharopolyspora spinosa TaxID=60894 RepID=UPI00376EAFFE
MLTPTDQAAQQDPSAAERKEQERRAKYRRAGMDAAARVVELEALKEQGPLTAEQEVELAELQPKAQQRQKQKEKDAKRHRAGKVDADRVVELEALKEQGPLTAEQEAELAEVQTKVAQLKQKKKEKNAKDYQARKAAAARVAELEALKEQGPLTVEQEAELAKIQPKVAQKKQKRNESAAIYRRAGKAAVARVAVLEALKEQGRLTVEQEAELAELQPRAQQWQKGKEFAAEWHRARTAAARVAVLKELEGRGQLTEEQAVELAELRSKAAGRGRKKKDREVTEAGVGGAPVVDRSAGPEGVSGWTGADQDDWDGWSADVDLDAWRAQAVADVDRAQVPQGAADAGVMLGADAYEEFVANGLAVFLGQDAGDDAVGVGGVGSVAGGFDFAGFLSDYGEGEVPLGCLGVKALTGCFSVSCLRRMRWGRMRGMRRSLGCGGCRSGSGGESVGVGYRFLRG